MVTTPPHIEHEAELGAVYASATASAKPLADAQGRPLLPAIATALAQGIALPSPVTLVAKRERSVLDAGAPYPAIDHELLAAYEARGKRLQSLAMGEALGHGLRWTADRLAALGRGVAGWISRNHAGATPNASQDYADRVSQFYGRGL